MNDPVVSADHVAQGQRLVEHLMKILTREDPRAALVALCLALPMAARACAIRVADTFRLLRTFEQAHGDFAAKLERPDSGLVVNG